jgi:hypothetical protein
MSPKPGIVVVDAALLGAAAITSMVPEMPCAGIETVPSCLNDVTFMISACPPMAATYFAMTSVAAGRA